MKDRLCNLVLGVYCALMPIIGIIWILSLLDYANISLIDAQVTGVVLGLAAGAAFLKHPYQDKPGWFELLLSLSAPMPWLWMSVNLEDWLLRMADRPPEMWVPGIFALVMMMEALRKSAGGVIAGLVWIIILYGFFGHHMPGVLEAETFPPAKTVLYLYADTNGVPGIVLNIVVGLVLAFIIFGKIMEISGAMGFFNDLAMGLMGHRRGGPAKVAVVASSAFGSISGSAVANIMSTGVVTIPLMKRTGFQARYAAAIEAVASNGGQVAPPVMGATAFIIAEFLEVPYAEVALAAFIPAIFYFLILFLQVDGVAVRYGIGGLPKTELPDPFKTFVAGWLYLVPIGVLIWILLGLGYRAGLAGLYACGLLFIFFLVRKRGLPSRQDWSGFFVGSGENLIPLVLIGGAAGIIIGLMNSTGLGFQLSLILTEIGQTAGILVMLFLTAFICILLGMGMPTAAVYIVLVSVVAPALTEMKIPEMSAHLFIFYFGLLSMLTPPVAIASMVAAQLAGSDMWRTGLVGLQLAAAAFLMPFLWVFNPAFLLDGSWQEIATVIFTAFSAGMIIGQMTRISGIGSSEGLMILFLLAATIFVGGATIWFGQTSPLTIATGCLGFGIVYGLRKYADRRNMEARAK